MKIFKESHEQGKKNPVAYIRSDSCLIFWSVYHESWVKLDPDDGEVDGHYDDDPTTEFTGIPIYPGERVTIEF